MCQFMRFFFVILSVISLSGCVTPARVPETQDSELLARFTAGQAALECGRECSSAFTLNMERIKRLQQDQDWDGLALAVMRINLRQDIGYFILGMAAEGKKLYPAANRYYSIAGALALGADTTAKCAGVAASSLCLGFRLPSDVFSRLKAIGQYLPATGKERTAVATPEKVVSASVDWIVDAPQSLLAQYAVRRTAGIGKSLTDRDAQFLEDLLLAFDPVLFAQTKGNEIARPRAISELLTRLGNQTAETRMSVGMYVQLKNFDLRSSSFEVHYPLHSQKNPPKLEVGIYSGRSYRSQPWSEYSSSGSACTLEPANSEFVPANQGEMYFVLMTMCHPHPSPYYRAGALDYLRTELPPLFNLNVVANALWQKFHLPKEEAEPLIRRLGSSRNVWAELVFDVSTIRQTYSGPFSRKQVLEQKAPAALTISIQPRALVMWELGKYDAGEPGRFIGTLGEVRPVSLVHKGRLPSALVADREYPSLPHGVEPLDVAPADGKTVSPADAGRGRNTTKRQPAATPSDNRQGTKAASRATEEDAWVEPPAAKR